VLFLDEPTLGLDPQTRSHVWEFIQKLKKSEGNTVFMTTHYMEEAEVCDRIAIIDRGRIIACDRPEELKKALRGDTIYLKTSDNEKAAIEIESKFGLKPRTIEGALALLVESGEKFIPRLFEKLETGISSVNLKRPSLEEVFINLTGREMRDEGPAPRQRP
jgi:ABC-2 type transport system ATP-binding protein